MITNDPDDAIDGLFSLTEVQKVADKILKETIGKIKDDLSRTFYHEIERYLYEHYDNVKDRIEKDIISKIADEFVSDPMLFKYRKFRDRLFEENKEVIIGSLANEQIENSIRNILFEFTEGSRFSGYDWGGAIFKFILNNIDLFIESQPIQKAFVRELDRRDRIISNLETRLKERE